MQNACAVLYCNMWPVRLLPYFSTLFHKRHYFWEKLLSINVCFDFVYRFCSEIFLFLRRIQRDIIIIYIRPYVKYPLFLSGINETCTFSTDFRKILRYQISWKSVQWEPSCSMQTDGLIDMTKSIVAVRSFANAPNDAYVIAIQRRYTLNGTHASTLEGSISIRGRRQFVFVIAAGTLFYSTWSHGTTSASQFNVP
jgi:hypothetical protein